MFNKKMNIISYKNIIVTYFVAEIKYIIIIN